MDVARDVIELFSIKDPARARALAARLDKLNGDRQEEERRILAEIETRVEQDPALKDAYCVVIDGEGWHRGVIGITATRVVERYGRPALVLSRDGEEAHGSGRSIRTFHLLQAIESCSHLFTRYGGHSHAVGFSLPTARVPELRTHLDQYARRCLSPADFEPVLDVDWELPIENVTPELLQVLARLEPFGQGNPEPVFVSRNVQLSAPPRILKDKHIKLKLSASLESAEENSLLTAPRCDPDASAARRSEVGAAEEKRGSGNWRKAITYEALGWRMAERVEAEKLLTGDTLDVAFTVGQNDHPEYGGLELTICDFKVKRPLAQTLAVKAGE
jgi:single-stranded-DNA-specific exonuclease